MIPEKTIFNGKFLDKIFLFEIADFEFLGIELNRIIVFPNTAENLNLPRIFCFDLSLPLIPI